MSIEAMKQWAEGVSKAYDLTAWGHTERAAEILRQTRDAIRTAIAGADHIVDANKTMQEPVAVVSGYYGGHVEAMEQALEFLQDNQHLVAENERHAYVMEYNAFIEKLEAIIEAKLKEKNA